MDDTLLGQEARSTALDLPENARWDHFVGKVPGGQSSLRKNAVRSAATREAAGISDWLVPRAGNPPSDDIVKNCEAQDILAIDLHSRYDGKRVNCVVLAVELTGRQPSTRRTCGIGCVKLDSQLERLSFHLAPRQFGP